MCCSSSSALSPLDQLAPGSCEFSSWAGGMVTHGALSGDLLYHLLFEPLSLWVLRHGLWACPPCTVLSTLVQSLWWLPPRACTRCKQTACCPHALSLKFLLWISLELPGQRCQPGFSIWGKANPFYNFPAVLYQRCRLVCSSLWYVFPPYLHMGIFKTFATYPEKKKPATVRGYCLPETPELRKANISWLPTQDISNLRLVEGWRPHQSKDRSVLHLIFCLHQWLLCMLKTGYRSIRFLAWPRKSVLITNKGIYFTAWTAAGSTHASLFQSGNKEWSWKGNTSFTLDLQPNPQAQVLLTDKQECSCGHSGFQSIWAVTHAATCEKSAAWDGVCCHVETDQTVPKTRLDWRPQA